MAHKARNETWQDKDYLGKRISEHTKRKRWIENKIYAKYQNHEKLLATPLYH
jgi:hypothetical protein